MPSSTTEAASSSSTWQSEAHQLLKGRLELVAALPSAGFIDPSVPGEHGGTSMRHAPKLLADAINTSCQQSQKITSCLAGRSPNHVVTAPKAFRIILRPPPIACPPHWNPYLPGKSWSNELVVQCLGVLSEPMLNNICVYKFQNVQGQFITMSKRNEILLKKAPATIAHSKQSSLVVALFWQRNREYSRKGSHGTTSSEIRLSQKYGLAGNYSGQIIRGRRWYHIINSQVWVDPKPTPGIVWFGGFCQWPPRVLLKGKNDARHSGLSRILVLSLCRNCESQGTKEAHESNPVKACQVHILPPFRVRGFAPDLPCSALCVTTPTWSS